MGYATSQDYPPSVTDGCWPMIIFAIYTTQKELLLHRLQRKERGSKHSSCILLLIQSDERTVERPRWSQAMSFVIPCLANLSFLPGFLPREMLCMVYQFIEFFIRR